MFLVPKHSNTIIIVLLSIVLIYSLGLCLQIKCKQFICCELFSVVKIEKKNCGHKENIYNFLSSKKNPVKLCSEV